MRAKLVVAAIGLAAAAGTATAGPKTAVTPVWLAPVELTPRSDYSILDQQVAVDPRANLLAVWSASSGVLARYRPAGGAWQAPVQLAACGVGAAVAFDAAGNATVVWLQCTSPVSQMTTAVRRVDGSWSLPVVLSTPGRSISYPHLAVAGSGAAVASWLESDGQVSVVQASVRAPVSNEWSPAAQVSSVGADAEDSSVAVDDTGDVVVGFTRGDPSGTLVWAASKTLVGDWQRAVDLSQPGASAYGIQVAIRPGGTAVAFWDEGGEGRLAVRPAATGTWSREAPFPLYSVQSLVADGSGDVVAAWQLDQVMVSELPAGSDAWQQPVAVPSTQPGMQGFTIGFDGRRGLVATWIRADTYDTGALVATRLPAGAAGWESPVMLGNLTGFFSNAHGTIDVDGDAIAAFETQNGASVATAILDAAAPRLRSLGIRHTGRVGQKLPFAAEPADISPVTYRWRFGDGRSALGASVTHAYGKPGRYRMTLVATDAAGHTTVATRASVRISKR
jgi:PKD domain-containing protein